MISAVMNDVENRNDSPEAAPDNREAPTPATKARVPVAKAKARVKKRRPGKKRMPPRSTTKRRILPTARISFSRQMDLLRAYGATAGAERRPVTHEDVAPIVRMAASTASLANPFFADAGLLERVDGGYVPSPEVAAFARMWRWDEDAAPRELAPLLARTWFAETLLPRLDYHPLSEREAIAELDREATAGPEYAPSLRILLDFLEAAGLIVRDGERVEPGDADRGAPLRAEVAQHEPGPDFRPSPPPPSGQHPLIEGLLRELPPSGERWTVERRERWLQLARLTVEMLYDVDEEAPAARTSSPDGGDTARDMPR